MRDFRKTTYDRTLVGERASARIDRRSFLLRKHTFLPRRSRDSSTSQTCDRPRDYILSSSTHYSWCRCILILIFNDHLEHFLVSRSEATGILVCRGRFGDLLKPRRSALPRGCEEGFRLLLRKHVPRRSSQHANRLRALKIVSHARR